MADEEKAFDDIIFELQDLCKSYKDHHDAVMMAKPGTVGEVTYRKELITSLCLKILKEFKDARKLVGDDDAKMTKVNKIVKFFVDTYIELGGYMIDILRKSEQSVKPKLEAIKLHSFDGSLENWLTFRDTFLTLVHNQRSLTNIQKFHYLSDAFKLPPGRANILSTFTISEDSYEDAWEAVKGRYDSKQKLKSQHIGQLFSVKKMTADTSTEVQRVLDSYASIINNLEKLDADNTDDLFCYIILQRLDEATAREYQLQLKNKDPTWIGLQKFLEMYWKSIEHLNPSKKNLSTPSQKPIENQKSQKKSLTASSSSTNKSSICTCCKENHLLFSCPKFQKFSVHDRYQFVKDNNLCVNCFSPGHRSAQCLSLHRCKTCKGTHHTLLHFDRQQSGSTLNKPAIKSSMHSSELDAESDSFVPFSASKPSSYHACHTGAVKNMELLSTVKVNIFDSEGNAHQCRALLDSGSDTNFISTSLAKKLNLTLDDAYFPVSGLSESTVVIRNKTTVKISSHYGPYERVLQCCVLPKVAGMIPNNRITEHELKIPSQYKLADPDFKVPAKIDLLLSNTIFCETLLSKKIHLEEGPMLIQFKFGWVLGGSLKLQSSLLPTYSHMCYFTIDQVDDKIEQLNEKFGKFMELENYGSVNKILSPEEQYCEQRYQDTTYQAEDGRYIVQLPLKTNIEVLGLNRSKAFRQFYYQEKKREADPELKALYVDYMRDFIDSKHMELVDPADYAEGHLLPHHGVKKTTSTTTKLRPVFNASCKSETDLSLNDCMCVGPTVQPESVDILIRFREKRYVLKGDIEKMYRQIFVDPSQRKYQKILWREDPTQRIQQYQINTVTFGVASSPFLATRTLNRIADDNKQRFPNVAEAIRTSIYVDDIILSHNDINEALLLRDQLRLVLIASQMPTRKWSSNISSLLQNLDESQREMLDNDESSIKTLGINWFPSSDKLSCNFKSASDGPVTKTTVLSELASVYDPLGFVGPVVLKMKIFMKTLWELKLKWTDELPQQQLEEWKEFQLNFEKLNDVYINRHLLLVNPVKVEMHGFSDACEHGYGIVIYLRSTDILGNIQVSLLCSKSRVSPPKQKSIARLELCAATLLSKLVTRMHSVLSTSINETFLWSDSMITLYWIKTMPSRLGTFVGNRVSVVQEHTEKFIWQHIRTDENPADAISRGLMPQDIASCQIWWNGPSFLTKDVSEWPESLITIDESDPVYASEFKKCLFASKINDLCEYVQTRFSSLRTTIRVIAYIKRFINNARHLRAKHLRTTGNLSLEELDQSRFNIIRILQQTLFPIEYKFFLKLQVDPKSKEKFPKKSNLRQLLPFMDTDGLIRTSGRLVNSKTLSYDQRHQIILPEGHFTKLIVIDLHKRHIHPGRKQMLSLVRENYWPLRIGSCINQVAHECIKCFRVNPKAIQQLMGSLPLARITSSPAFTSTAVDYTGHFLIKSGMTRNSSSMKVYIAVFKCMSTGAIHLELVSSLSSIAFEMTYDRFIARRGNCREIYSDNGTNFEGTDNDFKKIIADAEDHLAEYMKEKSIEWKFSPPRAPHYGGIYESGVKTIKHHLKRLLNDHLFTFEEFSTILCRIEAIVNSRPLTPMSEDPHDLEVLTPGHFLIGRPLIARPERNYVFIKENRLKKFELMQQVQQKFWDSWYHDYLHHLQIRPINFRDEQEILVGDLVLLKDSNLPPLQWLMGRITQTFPDRKGTVRQVIVKTIRGEKHRHVKYLCLLPFEKSTSQTFVDPSRNVGSQVVADLSRNVGSREPDESKSSAHRPARECVSDGKSFSSSQQ